MTIIFIRTIILYAAVILSVRLMGKRQIGELQPTELVITILISNIATMTIENEELPLMACLMPMFLLVTLEIIMSWLTLKNRRLRQLVSGSPQIIIRDGKIDQRQLRELRFSVDDVMESLRSNNVFDIKDVQFAIVETTGKISVYNKYSAREVTNSDMNFHKKSKNPPYVIVNDGIFLGKSFEVLGLNYDWYENILKKKNLETKDIFLMTAESDGTYNLIEREI